MDRIPADPLWLRLLRGETTTPTAKAGASRDEVPTPTTQGALKAAAVAQAEEDALSAYRFLRDTARIVVHLRNLGGGDKKNTGRQRVGESHESDSDGVALADFAAGVEAIGSRLQYQVALVLEVLGAASAADVVGDLRLAQPQVALSSWLMSTPEPIVFGALWARKPDFRGTRSISGMVRRTQDALQALLGLSEFDSMDADN